MFANLRAGSGYLGRYQATNECRTSNGQMNGPVSSVAISANGQRIVSGSEDRTVKVWNAITGEETSTFKGHIGPVNSVTFSADGKRIVSGSDDRTVKVWDVPSNMTK